MKLKLKEVSKSSSRQIMSVRKLVLKKYQLFINVNFFNCILEIMNNTIGCGGTLRTPTGVIQSPNYPSVSKLLYVFSNQLKLIAFIFTVQPYTNYRFCLWRIVAPVGRRVRLEFLDFDLEEKSLDRGELRCLDTVSVNPNILCLLQLKASV